MKLWQFSLLAAMLVAVVNHAMADEKTRVFVGTGSDGKECSLSIILDADSLKYISIKGNEKYYDAEWTKYYLPDSTQEETWDLRIASNDHFSQSIQTSVTQANTVVSGKDSDSGINTYSSFKIIGDIHSENLQSATYDEYEKAWFWLPWRKLQETQIICSDLKLQ